MLTQSFPNEPSLALGVVHALGARFLALVVVVVDQLPFWQLHLA